MLEGTDLAEGAGTTKEWFGVSGIPIGVTKVSLPTLEEAWASTLEIEVKGSETAVLSAAKGKMSNL